MRHELELRLQAEQESNEKLKETVQDKLEIIYAREKTIDELDARNREAGIKIETLHA